MCRNLKLSSLPRCFAKTLGSEAPEAWSGGSGWLDKSPLSHLRPGGRRRDTGGGAAVWKRELGSVPCSPRSESEGSGRQSRTGAFCSLLSNPYRCAEWEPQLSTRFLALISKWKSEQEPINTGAEPFGPPARASHPLPLSLRPPSPHPAARLRGSGPSTGGALHSDPPNPSSAKLPPQRGAESSSRRGRASGDGREGPAGSGAPLGKLSGAQVCAGRALHSQPRWERAGRGAAGRGQEGSESWPEWPLTQCLEACEGRQHTDRGCPSLSSREKLCDQPGAPLGVAITSPRTKTPAGRGSRVHDPPILGVKMREDMGKGVSPSFGGIWRPGVGGPLAASWPLRAAKSQARAPPPTPRQFGAQREHSNSFRRTQRTRRGYRPACESRKLT